MKTTMEGTPPLQASRVGFYFTKKKGLANVAVIFLFILGVVDFLENARLDTVPPYKIPLDARKNSRNQS